MLFVGNNVAKSSLWDIDRVSIDFLFNAGRKLYSFATGNDST
jgi:hypothetical protein